MSVRDWLAVGKRAGKGFIADGCTGLAKQIAFSSLLAFFPAVIALVGLLNVLDVYATLRSFLAPVAPRAVLSMIDTSEADSGGGGTIFALFLGAGAAIWASSGAMGTVVKAVNRAHDLTETRPFWRVRILSTLLVLAMAFVLSATLVLIVLGGTVGAAIGNHTGQHELTVVWDVLRWPVAFLAVLLLFALVYTTAPNEPRRRRRVTAGSVVGSVLWLGLSALFSLYTAYSDSFTKTYGALAGGIILLLWVNYSAWALLFGAELDSELEKLRP